METDITLINKSSKIIIDTKYYQKTMTDRYEQEKIKSENLYQLFSYLNNQDHGEAPNKTAIGILLYPTTDKEYDLDYMYNHHAIKIKTINLSKSWSDIAKRLMTIIDL